MASTAAQTTLSGKVSGAGTTVDFTDAKSKVTMVLVPSGAITAGVIAMEASQDGTNWVTVHIFDPVIAANQFYSIENGAFRYWRANVASTVTGGGSVTATVMEADTR
jgi:hypothetical protein